MMDRLQSTGVTVVKPIVVNTGAAYSHVRDNSGNEIVLAELPRGVPLAPEVYELVHDGQ